MDNRGTLRDLAREETRLSLAYGYALRDDEDYRDALEIGVALHAVRLKLAHALQPHPPVRVLIGIAN